MTLVLAVLIGWSVVTVVGVLGAAAVCRAGHREDVARGFVQAETAAQHPRGDVKLPIGSI
jgi:hypothetical protein